MLVPGACHEYVVLVTGVAFDIHYDVFRRQIHLLITFEIGRSNIISDLKTVNLRVIVSVFSNNCDFSRVHTCVHRHVKVIDRMYDVLHDVVVRRTRSMCKG